ncbi:TonB family protein [Agrobacterium sp. SORGH_AS 787]|uniref:TonB family protein n=1 Tax=Agrobacterium sp. SORGH_AS 787 TaxID=3041775 RepID=UPI00277E3CEA|nr:protein TonB [Rhizobium sp. SORGH_AS_0787]
MTDPVYPRSGQSRLGEVALWSAAALVMVSVHAAGAYYLMHEKPVELGDNAPQAAIMIELAALPEAVNTEQTVEANDEIETEEVKSNVAEPVDEPPPVEPPPEPVPEPVVEQPPPEPEPTPEVQPEIAQPVEQEPPPEPVQEIDPIEQQQVAELENVEVPLPVLRPPPPPVQKKVEKDKEPEKKRVQKPTQAQQQSQRRDIAKAEAAQSDRTAASRNSAGSSSSSISPADWASKVQSAVARRIVRGAGRSGMTVTVSFVVQNDGSIGRLSVVKSTGDEAVDAKIKSSIGRASVSTPPPGAQTSFVVPVQIR